MLFVHRSERADHLVGALGDLLLDPLDDPMAPEVVAVPTRGVERWLTQRLSDRLGTSANRADGVCANVEFPFPGSLVSGATSRACGFDPETDPWRPERAVWPLLELVDAHLDEPFLEPLAAHLRASSPDTSDGDQTLRRFSTLRHLADLYDRYAVHRPEMIRSWIEGVDATADEGSTDPHRAWQAELWRRLRENIGVPSPAERFEAASARVAAEPGLLELPARLSVFGLTRLPSSHLRVLESIAASRNVHLFLLHPSGALWERVERTEPRPPPGLSRDADPTAAVAAHPLLRSWGRDAREMQLVLSSRGVVGGEYRPVTENRETLLRSIQADIRADRQPAGQRRPGDAQDPRPVLDPHDDSLRIHACHGRARQVEVVRDAVLHLLDADSNLEPRDAIVMCPDIESFAPLIKAAFGTGASGPVEDTPARDSSGPPRLRVRLADRSLRQTNPLLAVTAELLELSGSRVTASQVLDLASREPVSRRFRFDQDDLSQIERWLAGTGVRWGLDAPHRRPWGLEDLDANTWSAGLDRLLLGVAMAEDSQHLFGEVLPFDDTSSTSVDLAGRLAELTDRLRTTIDELTGPQPVECWAAALAAGTERLAVADADDAWQHDQLHRLLDEAVKESNSPDTATASVQLDHAEVRSLLAERLRGRPTRANFRTGDLTICTLVPMRSVPHRVVCLLGLDDGAFPRHTEHDGDDLLLADPRVGDRDVRSEDRQLLLDALLASTEKLIITFEGRDQRTNQERPPAVPVAELLDVIDGTVRLDDATRRAREAVLVHHPLQSFDARNFSAGSLGVDVPWGFDPVNLNGARALGGERRHAPLFLPERLPPLDSRIVPLEALVRFVEHPVRAFLRTRLGVYVDAVPDQLSDALPVDLDPLEKWGVGDRLLESRLTGATAEWAEAAERGRGLLPPGALADDLLSDITLTVEDLIAVVDALPVAKAEAESVEINLPLPDGRSLVGTVPGVRDGTILRCIYSKLGPKHRLTAWVRFLALSAARPDLSVTAITIGRGEKRRTEATPRVTLAQLGLLHPDPDTRRSSAMAALGVLVDLYDRGMREPLPIYCATSAAWARAARRLEDPVQPARDQWKTSPNSLPNEDSDDDHVLVLGPAADFSELMALPPDVDETGDGWAESEKTRLGRLARRLWDPVLDHERLEER